MGGETAATVSRQLQSQRLVLLLGCGHQLDDNSAAVLGAKGDNQVHVQYVAHAGPIGHWNVDFSIADRITEGDPAEFGDEKQLFLGGCFLPNSYVENYFYLIAELMALWSDKVLRKNMRREFGLPVAGEESQQEPLLMVNISKADRMDKDFFDMVMEIMESVPHAFLVLIRHNLAAEKRITALKMDVQSMVN